MTTKEHSAPKELRVVERKTAHYARLSITHYGAEGHNRIIEKIIELDKRDPTKLVDEYGNPRHPELKKEGFDHIDTFVIYDMEKVRLSDGQTYSKPPENLVYYTLKNGRLHTFEKRKRVTIDLRTDKR